MISLKQVIISAAIISSLSFVSCESKTEKADKELANLAASNKSQDPSVTYKAKTLTYRYTVAPETYTRINPDSLKAKTLGELSSVTNHKLVKTLTEANANVQYVYVCDSDSIAFTFKPSNFAPVNK